MKILIIAPINNSQFNEAVLRECQSAAGPGTTLAITNLDHGSVAIESRYDQALNSPYVIEKAQQGQDQGFEGIFVSDFDYCGVEAAREVIDIPVIGGFRPAVFAAMALADKFSIVTVLPNVVPYQLEHARQFGILPALASIRQIGIPVTKLSDREKVIKATYEQSLCAIREERAEAIVLGCTGMAGVAVPVRELLLAKGYNVPVVAPNTAAVPYLELFIRNRLTQSRLTYYQPGDYHPEERR